MNKITKYIARLFIFITSFLIMIFLVEIILRFTPFNNIRIVKYIPNLYCPDEICGGDLCPNIPPTTIKGEEYSATLFTNELGCYDKPYNQETDFILLVGDSFTFGHADFKDKYGTLLENFLDYRVLKCGVSGYGTYQQLCKIKKIINKIKRIPKLVIVGYWYGDDMRNDLDIVNKGLLSQELLSYTNITSSKNSSLSHIADSKILFIKKWIQAHSVLYHMLNKNVLVRLFFSRFGLVDTHAGFLPFVSIIKYPELEKAWRLHLGILKKLKTLALEYNFKLLIVLLPADFQVYDFLKPRLGIYDFEQPQKILHKFFEEEGIKYFDLLPYMRQYADNKRFRLYIDNQKDLYWRRDGHFNIRGNRLVALLLARYIIQENIIKIDDAELKKQKIEQLLEEFK